MEIFIGIATIVALCSVSALCLYAIVVLKDVRSLLQNVQEQLQSAGSAVSTLLQSLSTFANDAKELRQRMTSMIASFEQVAKNSALITQKLHDDMQGSGGIFAEVEALRLQLKKLREFVDANIVRPARQVATFVSAITQAASAFVQVLQPSSRNVVNSNGNNKTSQPLNKTDGADGG